MDSHLRSVAGAFVALACLFTSFVLAQESPHGDLSISCSQCHGTEGWLPLAEPLPFDHEETGFPLETSHRGVDCRGCHQDLEFRRVPTACADCHGDVHRGELGLDCASCHDPKGWEQARWEMLDRHSATLFPLLGSHRSVDCEACHRSAPPHQFATTSIDCYSCHSQDYQATRNPNHVQAGFPLTCETCHDVDDWIPADFRSHDSLFFPIFSGPHAGVWGACTDCHTSPGTFANFSCLTCHRRGEMEDEHDDVNGYVYQSSACLSCHPSGRE